MAKFELIRNVAKAEINFRLWISIPRVVFEGLLRFYMVGYVLFKVLAKLLLQLRFHRFNKRLSQQRY